MIGIHLGLYRESVAWMTGDANESKIVVNFNIKEKYIVVIYKDDTDWD